MISERKPQDNEREAQLVTWFALQSTNENRIGIDAADEFNYQYELKTTTKAGVSTARDVGLNHIAKWRKLIWICAKGHYQGDEFIITDTYVLYPSNLEQWFRKIEAKVTRRKALFSTVISLMRKSGFADTELVDVESAFERGVLLNDPNIPWSYVEQNGVRIDKDHAAELRRLLKANPPQFVTEDEQVASLEALFA
jgi:hypothetical protein